MRDKKEVLAYVKERMVFDELYYQNVVDDTDNDRYHIVKAYMKNGHGFFLFVWEIDGVLGTIVTYRGNQIDTNDYRKKEYKL